MAVREPTCTGIGVTEVPLLLLIAFIFPSSEESRIFFLCWVNRENFRKVPRNSSLEPRASSARNEWSNHFATVVRSRETGGGATAGRGTTPSPAWWVVFSILKPKPVSRYPTWRTRQDSGAANTESTALKHLFCLRVFFWTVSLKP